MDLQTETRTYVGQTATQAFDGMAGFRIGQSYQLRFARRDDGTVAIELDHAAEAGRQLVVNEAEFARWFTKS